MEAISISPATANHRPTGAQAQNELGDIFQDLLRESAARLETPAAPPRYDDRAERRNPHPEPARTTARAASDRPSELDRPDGNDDDFNAVDARNAAEPQSGRDHGEARHRESPIGYAEEPAPAQTAHSSRPSQGEDSFAAPASTGTETPDPATGSKLSMTAAAGPATDVEHAAPLKTEGQFSLAGILAGANPAAQVNTEFASGKAGGAAPPPATASVPPQGSAGTPEGNSNTKPAAAVTGSSTAIATQVSIKPAALIAQPAANLGGGQAVAALATATAQELAGPAAPGTEMGQRTAPNAANPGAASTAPHDQAFPGTGNPQGGAPNTRVLSGDGQIPAAQAANSAAAAQARGADTPAGQVPNADLPDAPSQSGQAAAARTQQTLGNPAPTSGGIGEAPVGQGTPGQGEAGKTVSTPTQDVRVAQQSQGDPAAKAQTQTPPPANASASGSQSAQIGQSQVSVHGGPAGDAGGTAGSTGQADAVSSRAASLTPAATGGFTQPTVNLSTALASPSRSDPPHPLPTDQVAVQIQKAVGAGKDHVRVRLNPAELGQIDVSLKVRHDGTIRAIVTVDRPETFDLLQRDARGLERALHDAGLKTDSGSLSFNLRGGEQHGPNDGQRGPGLAPPPGSESGRMADASPPEVAHPAAYVSNRVLDIHV